MLYHPPRASLLHASRTLRVAAAVGGASLLSPAALAETGTDLQWLTPPSGRSGFVFLEDGLQADEGFHGGVLFHYAQRPLVCEYPDGTDDPTSLVDYAGTLDTHLSYGLSRFRLGVNAPFQPVVETEYSPTTRLSDPGLQLEVAILDRSVSPVGLSLDLGTRLPLGDPDAWGGHPATRFSGGLNFSTGSTWLVVANLGMEHGLAPDTPVAWASHPRAVGGLGLATPEYERSRASLELHGGMGLSSEASEPWLPGEAVLSISSHPVGLEDLLATFGVGLPVMVDVGVPDFRVIAGLAWSPAPRAEARPSLPDHDADGIPDVDDRCLDQAEDKDGQFDEDGCPEGDNLTPTTLRLTTVDGDPVCGAEVQVREGPLKASWHAAGGSLTRSLPTGRYLLTISSEGLAPLEAWFQVPRSPTFDLSFVLHPPEEQERGIHFVVLSPDGTLLKPQLRPHPLEGEPMEATGKGMLSPDLPPGTHEVVIWAPGRRVFHREVEVPEDEARWWQLTLPPTRVSLEEDRIRLTEPVRFPPGEIRLLPESRSLLDELAEFLRDRPEIFKVLVTCRTSEADSPAANNQLSRDRGDRILLYLHQAGLSGDRLRVQGLGGKGLEPGQRNAVTFTVEERRFDEPPQ